MEHAARRPIIALAALTTAGALGLAPVVVTPPDLHAPTITQSQISARELQLTDAWSDLFAATGANVTELVKLFVGAESGVPLPNPTIFLAPIATQIVLNQLIYVGQLFSGQGGQIPGEIQTHLTNVGKVMGEVIPACPRSSASGFRRRSPPFNKLSHRSAPPPTRSSECSKRPRSS